MKTMKSSDNQDGFVGIYAQIKTKERLPSRSGYYAIETDRIYGNVHWSVENQRWTLESGEILDSDYPNYWLDKVYFKYI